MGSAGFEHVSSHLDGLRVFLRTAVGDTRGEFSRVFDSEIIRSVGVDSNVRQVNYVSNPRKGTVRGLHYQKAPHEETKTVTCLRGRAFDVAVDIRKDSPTFLQWHAEILDTDETKTIVIPGGFAHGYQTMEDNTELLYFCNEAYAPFAHGGLNPFDEAIRIQWPVELTEVADRDSQCEWITNSWRGV